MIQTVFAKLAYSLAGLKDTWKTEPSFRHWTMLVIISDLAAFAVFEDRLKVALILAAGFLLLASELINTAVEAVVDLVSPDKHDLAKKAKDAGSAMTLVTFIGLATLWILFL